MTVPHIPMILVIYFIWAVEGESPCETDAGQHKRLVGSV